MSRSAAASPSGPRRHTRLADLALAGPGLVVVVLTYVPLVGLMILSFSDRPMTGLPYPLTLRWYEHLGVETRWVGPLWTSLGLALVIGIVSMIVATIVGRALPRLRRRSAALSAFLLPLFVPGVLMGVALFLYYRGFLDQRLGLWSLLAGHFVWAFPFALLSVLVVTSRFDERLLSAAADLGASPWQRFWQIELPILRPGIVGAGIFGFLLSFNELSRSIYLRGVSTTLPLFEWTQASSQTSNVPYLFALSSIILVVSLPVVSAMMWILFRRAQR
jgi:ABC-type spermidine/putrescine transport system permease subunit II